MPRHKPKSPFTYTNRPLLPPNPRLVPGKHTPRTLLLECWKCAPPICAECGLHYVRPKRTYYFCSGGCAQRWQDRLNNQWIPIKYRNKDWPGKAAGVLPPEIQAVRDQWNRDLDTETGQINKCLAVCKGYPSNEWPLVPDRRGKLCQLPAGHGTNHLGYGRCSKHGGNTPAYNTRAMRAQIAEQKRVDTMIYGSPVEEIQPEEAIMQELARTAGHVQWLFEKMQEVETEIGQDAALQQSTKLGRTPAVWVDLYYRERQHLMAVAKTAASMGIAERQIRLAEEQGRLLADVIRAFMNDPALGLTPEQMVRAPELMRKHLAAIPMSTQPRPAAPSIVGEDGAIIDVEAVEDDPED